MSGLLLCVIIFSETQFSKLPPFLWNLCILYCKTLFHCASVLMPSALEASCRKVLITVMNKCNLIGTKPSCYKTGFSGGKEFDVLMSGAPLSTILFLKQSGNGGMKTPLMNIKISRSFFPICIPKDMYPWFCTLMERRDLYAPKFFSPE